MADSTAYDGAFVTKIFANDAGVPLVKFTEVKDTPHVYLQEESVSIWNEFFSKYSRSADGTLYYQPDDSSAPVAVTPGQYTASGSWYKAAVTKTSQIPPAHTQSKAPAFLPE